MQTIEFLFRDRESTNYVVIYYNRQQTNFHKTNVLLKTNTS